MNDPIHIPDHGQECKVKPTGERVTFRALMAVGQNWRALTSGGVWPLGSLEWKMNER